MSFSKKERAKDAIYIGQRQIRMAQEGKADSLPEKLSNKERLKMAREGTKNKLEGIRKLNKESKDGGKAVRDTVMKAKRVSNRIKKGI